MLTATCSRKTARKTKSERIGMFYELLKSMKATFDNPLDAYQFLRKSLAQIEEVHSYRDAMFLFPFSDFRYNEEYKLFYQETTKEYVVIQQCGAYAIYRIADKSAPIDFTSLSMGIGKIIEMPNKHGYRLWPKSDLTIGS